jgi:hypothetical protein
MTLSAHYVCELKYVQSESRAYEFFPEIIVVSYLLL